MKSYQAMSSATARVPSPDPIMRVLLLMFCIYDAIVSIDTYTNRIKEIDLTRCSIEFPGMTKGAVASGIIRSAAPCFGAKSKDDFRPWDMAMKKYPTACAARPPVFRNRAESASRKSEPAMRANPTAMEINASVSRRRFGLPMAV